MSGYSQFFEGVVEETNQKGEDQRGLCSQNLYEDLTVRQNLTFYAGIYGVSPSESKSRINEMIAMARLTGREDEYVANLSRGWKQRLALGCAIIAKPKIVFLDEPTSGVSPTSRRMFFNIIQDMAQEGTTVMVTTHFMDEAERCHKIAFISEGQLIAMDTPTNLKHNTLEGFLVELELPDPMNRTTELEQLPYVRESSIHGTLLHVLLVSADAVHELQSFTGVESRPIIPSLEDVFLTLAKKQRDGGERK